MIKPCETNILKQKWNLLFSPKLFPLVQRMWTVFAGMIYFSYFTVIQIKDIKCQNMEFWIGQIKIEMNYKTCLMKVKMWGVFLGDLVYCLLVVISAIIHMYLLSYVALLNVIFNPPQKIFTPKGEGGSTCQLLQYFIIH